MKKFRCACDKEFDDRQYFINHAHREHADNAWLLWDALGTTGYPFADQICKRLTEDLRTSRLKVTDVERLKNERDEFLKLAQNAQKDLMLIQRVLDGGGK